MRHEPQTTGGSHDPDYVGDTKFPTILVPDVDRSHAVPVPGELAPLVRATEDAPCDLAPSMSALRTGTAGIRFLLQDNLDPTPLGLIGEQEAHAPVRPLVNLLVIGGANISRLPDIAHIANDQRSHACLVQRGDQFACLLVLNLSNLVFDLLQLFLFRADDALAPLRPFLHLAVDAGIEGGLQLVAVLDFGAQDPPIENMRVGAIVSRRHMHFAKINACNPLSLRTGNGLRLVGRNRLVLRSRPADDHRVRKIPWPGQHQRRVALAVGEPKRPLYQLHRGAFVFDAEVPLALMRRFGIRIVLATLPPTRKCSKEGLYAGIGCMGMEVVGGVPAHEVLGFQPDAFASDGTPKGNERLRIESPAFVRQFIELFACADLHAAYLIVPHMYVFFFSAPKTVICFIRDARGARAKAGA